MTACTIRTGDLGVDPVTDAELVRLPVPPTKQERRQGLSQSVGKQAQEARVAVRAARCDAMNRLKDAEKEKQISEDDRKLGEKMIYDLTDKYLARVDAIAKATEQQIMAL